MQNILIQFYLCIISEGADCMYHWNITHPSTSLFSYHAIIPEAEFLDVIGTKVLKVFLLAIHSHLHKRILLPSPPEQKWFETGL
jgi:hypothetical protein